MTLSGPKVLSGTTSRIFTYPREISDLWQRLQPQYRHILLQFCIGLDSESLSTFKSILKSISDGQFDVLAQAFNYTPMPRLQKYLEIRAMQLDVSTQSLKVVECRSILETFNECYQEACSNLNATSKPPSTKELDIDAKSGGACLSSSDISRRIREADYNVLVTILEAFAKTTFAPGYAFPDQKPNNNNHFLFQERAHQNPDLQAFLALDRALFAEYQKAFYSQNTWVIGPGSCELSPGFLDQIEDNQMRIRSIYLAFTTDDYKASDLLDWTQASMLVENGGAKLNNIQLLERYASSCDACCEELLKTWARKFHHIAWLDLDDLTLDMTKAYGPDGVFLPTFFLDTQFDGV